MLNASIRNCTLVFSVILVILFTDAQENAQSGADPTDGLLPRGDAGFGDSLHDSAHGKSAGSQADG